MKRTVLICTSLLVFWGCGEAEETPGEAQSISRADARQMGGLRDGLDLCESEAWYSDNVCDEFCPQPDSACAGNCGRDANCAPIEGCEGEDCTANLCVGGQCTLVGSACTATFKWWQKDAYLETAGRNWAGWPPHTTTSLDVTCGDVELTAQEQVNHGTAVTDTDLEGNQMLVAVKESVIQQSRAVVLNLMTAMAECECDTDFLSLDAVNGDVESAVIAELRGFIEEHLVCELDGAHGAILGALQRRNLDDVLEISSACQWAGDFDWKAALLEALQSVLARSGELVENYHVCNNDAQLQAALFEAAKTAGDQSLSCDALVELCHGPTFFYQP